MSKELATHFHTQMSLAELAKWVTLIFGHPNRDNKTYLFDSVIKFNLGKMNEWIESIKFEEERVAALLRLMRKAIFQSTIPMRLSYS